MIRGLVTMEVLGCLPAEGFYGLFGFSSPLQNKTPAIQMGAVAKSSEGFLPPRETETRRNRNEGRDRKGRERKRKKESEN